MRLAGCMFDFGSANERQKEAIQSTEGPVLLIAGPGSGKTFTLVKRIAYLVRERRVPPGQIMAVTFTEKAARELTTRISDEFLQHGETVDLHEMYIGTFHAVCLRLMKEYGDQQEHSRSSRILDTFEQTYLVYRNLARFQRLGGYDECISSNRSRWRQAQEICRIAGQLCEEMVDAGAMCMDPDEDMRFLGRLVLLYKDLLKENNAVDFASIQTRVLELFQEHPDALNAVRDSIRYIMVDEYQDTNYIQEQLVFLFSGESQNICVVGDDDQGMYRFRGATIRNILEFPNQFKYRPCKQIELDVNYRSKSDIIRFYSRWMEQGSEQNFFRWGDYRYEKHLKACEKNDSNGKYVYRCGGSAEAEKQEVLALIRKLQIDGNIENLNQIAFLFRSVKSAEAKDMAEFLENNGIPVYSPRSQMFFERNEVRQILGCMMICFPSYRKDVRENTFNIPISDGLREYYYECLKKAAGLIKQDRDLKEYVETASGYLANPGTRDFGLLDLFYQLLSFEPFAGLLRMEPSEGAYATRPARNLSEISRMISQFCFLYNMHVVTEKNMIRLPESFFNSFLKAHYLDGVGEYEDNSEFAPDGCVSFMTIHQSKGLEFPVVITGSIGGAPKGGSDPLMQMVEMRYFKRRPYEPLEDIKYFDFWRLYYTAFSRARNFLVLAQRKMPGNYFGPILENIPKTDEFYSPGERFGYVKPAFFKKVYSFTSHISVYEECPSQYKYYREYEFARNRMFQISLGTLVHATLEDLNRCAMADRLDDVNADKIREWFYLNYHTMREETGYFLTENQQEKALEQVFRYYRHRKEELGRVWKAEEEISLVLPGYILRGVVDLVEGRGDTVEIVDYKTGPKPDIAREPHRLDQYKKQLDIYAYLIRQRYGKTVSRMHLYYTSTMVGDPLITFEYREEDIQKTIREFTRTVEAIENKKFTDKARNDENCVYCDLKFVCGKYSVKEAFDE